MPPRDKASDDERRHLTEAELAGLDEMLAEDEHETDDDPDAGDDDVAAAAEAGAAAAKPATDDPAKAVEDPAKAVEEPAKPGEEKPAAAAVEEPAAPDLVDPTASVPPIRPPENADARLDEIRTKLDELDKKFDDGELTALELRTQQRALLDDEREIRDDLLRATMARDQARTIWMNQTVKSFLADKPEYKPGSLRHQMLDQEVRRLQTEALENGRSNFDPTILANAHKKIVDELGAAPGAKQPAPTNPPPKKELPPSLSGLPAADMTETTDNSHFAVLDRLATSSPEKFEAEMAKMSVAERERYLESGG